MGFYFSKEEIEKREKNKNFERKAILEIEKARKQEEKKLKEMEQNQRTLFIKDYFNWFSKYTQLFLDEIKEKGFIASWGFETSKDEDYTSGLGGEKNGNLYIFDVPQLEALAFDMESKQMLYFTCKGRYYNSYKNDGQKASYEYVLIPFNKIFNVKVEVDSKVVFTSNISSNNVVGRSIVGGLIGGDAGAIIGGVTASKVSNSESTSLPAKIAFNIQTTDEKYPFISFEFKKSYGNTSGAVGSDKDILDIMCGIFSSTTDFFQFHEINTSRNCGTNMDYLFKRIENLPNDYNHNDPNEYMPVIEYKTRIAHLEIIQKRISRYAMQIEAIIKQCSVDNYKNVNMESKNLNNVIDEIIKLSDLMKSGVISEEEFKILKSKLI